MAENIYEDDRFRQVEEDKKSAMENIDSTYEKMIEDSDDYYQKQIEASQQWADTQSKLQQEQTDFAIEKLEQQKEQTRKDYIKEQSGAYVDWQKQSNQYGANAESMASMGMTGTGYSESSQVSMYNTYQNRVASARSSFELAKTNYDNAMNEARLQNNSVLAQIAYEALQAQLELSLQNFQYKNTLILEKTNKKLELENTYYNRYQDVLAQINYENAQKSSSSGKGSGSEYVFDDEEEYEPINTERSTSSFLSKDKTDDLQSILNLGYGAITEGQLASLLESGEVKRELRNGVYYYTRDYSALSSKNLSHNRGQK